MKRFCYLLFFVCGIFGTNDLTAQQANSPYSRFGLGDLIAPMGVPSMSMGGLGVSYYNPVGLNMTNPALLTANNLTIFEGGASVEEKLLKGTNGQQRDFFGNLDYLAFGFPIARRVRLGMGIQPYSRVNYQNILIQKIEGSDRFAEYFYEGSGGMTQGYLSGAVEVLRGLSFGAQFFYNFGSSTNQSRSRILGGDFVLSPQAQIESIQLTDRVSYSDWNFKLGGHYRYRLPNQAYINIGATYEPATNISSTRYRALEAVNYTLVVIGRDTLLNDQSIAPRLPERFTAGISLQKPLNEAGRSRSPLSYTIGGEVSWQDWEQSADVNFQEALGQYLRVSVGGEITPNIVDATSGYLSKITYRAGLRYERTPFAPDGIRFEERSVSFGVSIPNPKPLNRYQGFSRLHIGMAYGQRKADGQALSETFFRLHLGLTIQQPWFYRRRYE
ncbi:MAG: hypothetical protein ACFCUI_08810 [Bernardetiaceae bacterium]